MAQNVLELPPRASDAELVSSALAGDAQAKEQLYKRHVRMAAATAYRLLGGDTDLEDVVQDSFVAAFATLGKLENADAFPGWLSRIVTRTSIDTIRRRRLLARLGILRLQPIHVETLVSPAAPPEVAAQLSAVYRVLQELPTAERVVLVLRRVEQLTIAEVAERTGWSPATVKRKLARAEKHLDGLRGAEEGTT
ncbi:MAG: sigma-70 family RNA polymerase sigma factor [Polyangiaceae bacterium]|nr:sigma-70 family RNA polymerase sigma factor [Myxococcales bacterium]MCB9590907.1 sigma-70 family RNA polymerase sigma factor [Polyangiaceae bacterium]MCB9609615.1 sigma-70 family RNA polymerase sigma factor [Polyangiaceae bacterium]